MPTSTAQRRSRREEYSDATREALVNSALAQFAERGYAGTSLDAVAAEARVTKGALYHHFTGKRALFEAVFDAVERQVIDQVTAAASPRISLEAGVVCLRAYLDACLEPHHQRIVWQDGPAVLGHEPWIQACQRHSLGVIRGVLESWIAAGDVVELPIEAFSRTVFWVLGSAGSAIAESVDPVATRADYEHVIERLVVGLRPS